MKAAGSSSINAFKGFSSRIRDTRMGLFMDRSAQPRSNAEDRCTRNLYEKLAPKTRMRNLHLLMPLACAHPGYPISVRKLSHVIACFSHQIEHVLFDARNLHEKNLAASRYDTRTSFSRKLTRTSFSCVCHQHNWLNS